MAEKKLVVDIALKSGNMQQQIGTINKEIKNLKSEFSNAGAGVDKFESTIEGATAKIKMNEQILEKLKQKLTTYKAEQEKCTQALDKAVASYKKQETEVKSLESALDKAKATYGASSKEVKDLEVELSKATKVLDTKRNAVVNTNNKLIDMNSTINKTEAEVKQTTTEINKLGNELEDIKSGKVKDVGEDFDEAKEKATLFGAEMAVVGGAIANVGDKVGQMGKDILGAMGDLVTAGSEYSASVAGTEFLLKNMDKTTQDLIRTNSGNADTIGLTSKQYTDSATSMANYYKNMGLTSDATNTMTDSTMGLVADLGAITDMPFEDAMGRFKSGLMGNFEALDKMGINISANTLANSDYVLGLGKTWNELSDNEKMMATYNEIVRQSASATGLAGQESEGFGIQSNLLKARIDELKGAIGERLLPILQPFLDKVNEIVLKISTWAEANPEIVTAILTIATILGVVLVVVGTLLGAIGSFIIIWGAVSMALATASIPFMAIIGVIALVIGAVILIAGAVRENFDGIMSAIGNLKTSFMENFTNIQDKFQAVWDMMKSIYDTVVQPLFETIGTLIEGVINFIADIMPGISIAFGVVCDILTSIWNSVGKPIMDFVMKIFSAVVGWIVDNLPFISDVFNTVMKAIKTVWDNVGKPVMDLIKIVIDTAIKSVTPIVEKLGHIFKTAFGVIKDAWNILKPIFQVLLDVVTRVIGKVIEWAGKFKDKLSQAFESVLRPINRVTDAIAGLMDWIGSASSKVSNFLEKVNPFSSGGFLGGLFKMDTEITPLDTSVMNKMMSPMSLRTTVVPTLENTALSGSYYNAKSVGSNAVTDIMNMSRGFGGGTSSGGDSFSLALDGFNAKLGEIEANSNNKSNSMLEALAKAMNTMSEAMLSMNTGLESRIVVQSNVNIDGKAVAKATSPYMDKFSNKNNRLALR